jgi:hypothetical protein
MDRVNDGIREFVKKTHGHMKDAYLTLSPVFDAQTNSAVKVTTDSASATFAITASALNGVGGTTLSTAFTTAIRASAIGTGSLAWNSSSWYFSLTIAGASSITIEAPSGDTYVDATYLVFGGGSTQSGTTYTGGFPEDCTVETSLPTDFDDILYVEWDNDKLLPAQYDIFLSPETSGTPEYYGVKGKKIRISPVPTSQKLFHIWYKAHGTQYTSVSLTATTCDLDSDYHMAPVYWAAAELASDNFETEREGICRSKFQEMVTGYIIDEANKSTKIGDAPSGPKMMGITFRPA